VGKFVINNTSPSNYVWERLEAGGAVYVDRQLKYVDVPASCAGLDVLRTAGEDAGARRDAFVCFDVNYGARVYVAHDPRILTKPPWLAAFADSWEFLDLGETGLQLAWRDFLPGRVALGGNEGAAGNMYTVVVRPWGVCPTAEMRLAQISERVEAAYDAGKADEALKALREAGLEGSSLCAKIEKVTALVAQAQAAAKEQRFAEALQAAESLLAAESSPANAYRRQAEAMIASLRQEAANILERARAAQQAGKLTEAARLYWQTAELAPGNEEVNRALSRLKREAQLKLNLALNARRDDPKRALELFRETMALLPPGHEIYKQAQTEAEKLAPGK
jgi:tetratricopeptide (TPR) repeat protein